MSTKYLLTAVAAALIAAPACAQSVKAGIEAWQRADYSGAVGIWRPLALHGDADAQFNLGQAYRLGRGVPLDLSLAKVWFLRAANSGHVDAQTTLGLLLFQNGEKDEGVKWLKQAADQNEPRAQLVYGTALYNGDGVTQDRLLGYAYVSRAANQGLAPAQDTLSQLDDMLPLADRKLALTMAAEAQHAVRHVEKPKSEALKAPLTPPTKVVRAAPSSAKPPVAKATVNKPLQIAKATPAKPAQVAAVSGHWRIQLGAFGQRGSAEALYRRISGKSSLAGRTPYYVNAGPVIRLQVGPYPTRAAAASACATVGTACFPVAAD